MASAIHVSLLVLAFAAVSQAQNKASCPAKYRYQFFYQLNDPTPENIKAIDALVMKRMREECDKEVLAFGHGGAISTKPSTYGFATATPTSDFADYASWSDWASLEDMKACIEKGTKSGSIANMRKYVKKASRVVYELASCPTLSNAPATVRYMFNYKLADFSPATCKKATELQSKLTTTLGALRYGGGCDLLNSNAQTYGDAKDASTRLVEFANYGSFVDFKDEKDMTTYLTSTDPKATPIRKELRGLSAASIRIAIALPATSYTGGGAKVAKERGFMP